VLSVANPGFPLLPGSTDRLLAQAPSFGIGGAIGDATAEGPVIFVFPIMGAVGGASISLLLGKRARAILMALTGAVGFGVGSLPVLLISGLAINRIDVQGAVLLLVLGAAQGVVGVASLGLGLRDPERARYLLLGATLGFGIGALVARAFVYELGVPMFVIWGAIGGAGLGAALGYLEKKKADTQS